MDEPGEHHSQQTDTRAENEMPHILTHRQVVNNDNTWTQGREHYILGPAEFLAAAFLQRTKERIAGGWGIGKG